MFFFDRAPARTALALTLALAFGACDRGTPPAATPIATTADKPGSGDPPATITAPSDNPGSEPAAPPEIVYAEIAGLHYLERIIGDAAPDDALPMVVAIHGLGDRPENFARVLEAFPEPIRLILPRGLDEQDDGFSWFPIRAREQKLDALAQGIDHAADVVAAGLSALMAARPTRGKPIVTGFSQGGMLSFELAVHHPEVVGYAVPVGGWLPPPLWPTEVPANVGQYPAIAALHGTADNAVPFEPTQLAVAKLAELGFPATLSAYEGVPHSIAPPVHRDMTDHLIDAVQAAAKLPPQPDAGARP